GVAGLASRSLATTRATRVARAAGLPVIARAARQPDQVPEFGILGVVMAGGRNTRFGDLKAYAEIGGRPIIERVIAALRHVTSDVVVIANDAAAYAPLGLAVRRDAVQTGSALAGVLTALCWSEERGAAGIVTIACDMPFASGALLACIVATARETNADVVAPESGGPRGVEPLFAFYSRRCIPAIEAAIARGDQRMIGFHDAVRVVPIGIDAVRAFGEPPVLFMNVNTREELARAQDLAQNLAP
ncbi:MAG: molybdenum cofactor guanylyltransferase, partial [Gemmatimonadota bacterium]